MTQTNNYGTTFATDRALWKMILFNFLTGGIYSIVFYSILGDDLNKLASKRDHKNTMHYCLVFFLLTPITAGIFLFVWMHQLSARVGDEARARGIHTSFGASTYWLWGILGSFICVGPFIYMYQLCSTMNAICAHHNTTGI